HGRLSLHRRHRRLGERAPHAHALRGGVRAPLGDPGRVVSLAGPRHDRHPQLLRLGMAGARAGGRAGGGRGGARPLPGPGRGRDRARKLSPPARPRRTASYPPPPARSTPMRIVSTPEVPRPKGHYSHAVVHGDTVWVAGQLAIDPKNPDEVPGDAGAQTRLILRNIGAILEE